MGKIAFFAKRQNVIANANRPDGKMKTTQNIKFVLLLTISACAVLRPVRKLIDQKDDYIWTGFDDNKNYVLTIDNAEDIWFTGKIIIDFQDTLFLKGFEKGSNHPTTVKEYRNDSINSKSLGQIFIWTRGYKADSVEIKNNGQKSIPQLPAKLVLIKTRKTSKKTINKQQNE